MNARRVNGAAPPFGPTSPRTSAGSFAASAMIASRLAPGRISTSREVTAAGAVWGAATGAPTRVE